LRFSSNFARTSHSLNICSFAKPASLLTEPRNKAKQTAEASKRRCCHEQQLNIQPRFGGAFSFAAAGSPHLAVADAARASETPRLSGLSRVMRQRQDAAGSD
jgi:hypothetical protein